jgi:hypothetical protein
MTNTQNNVGLEQRKKENKAKYCIQNSVDDSILSKITRVSTTKQPWDILKSSYQGNHKVKKIKPQTLRNQFEILNIIDT